MIRRDPIALIRNSSIPSLIDDLFHFVSWPPTCNRRRQQMRPTAGRPSCNKLFWTLLWTRERASAGVRIATAQVTNGWLNVGCTRAYCDRVPLVSGPTRPD